MEIQEMDDLAHATNEEISTYVEGRSSGKDSKSLESHLRHCDQCRDLLKKVKNGGKF